MRWIEALRDSAMIAKREVERGGNIQRRQRDLFNANLDVIELTSRESFAAGDAPRWTGIHAGSFDGQTRGTQLMQTLLPPLSLQDHLRGDTDATVTLIEYGDYQCPYCASAEPVVVEILRRCTGVLQTFRHFPLVAIHDMAKLAAETAEFAASHGRFWPMHGALMAHSSRLSIPLLLSLASQLGLPQEELRAGLFNGTLAAKVGHDFARGMLNGVEGTPTLFINGKRYVGPMSVGALGAAIDTARDAVMATAPRMHVRA